ncbi:hypothetical protein HYX01_01885 [Candidatus Woesearchaeota archaeon]|nr:hypothetical protein [Candidatus Woesearchaeota archaeon]
MYNPLLLEGNSAELKGLLLIKGYSSQKDDGYYLAILSKKIEDISAIFRSITPKTLEPDKGGIEKLLEENAHGQIAVYQKNVIVHTAIIYLQRLYSISELQLKAWDAYCVKVSGADEFEATVRTIREGYFSDYEIQEKMRESVFKFGCRSLIQTIDDFSESEGAKILLELSRNLILSMLNPKEGEYIAPIYALNAEAALHSFVKHKSAQRYVDEIVRLANPNIEEPEKSNRDTLIRLNCEMVIAIQHERYEMADKVLKSVNEMKKKEKF